MNTLGKRVKWARLLRDLEQKDLAKQAGLTIPYMSQIENDHVNPRADVVVRLAQVLNVSTDFLLLGKDKEKVSV
jgi:transcriptional regulator with XRE-family HTH domain